MKNTTILKQDNSHPTGLKSSVDLSMFTPEEIRQAEQLVPHIDIHDYALVFNYGDEAQKKLSTSSDRILRQVKSKVSIPVEEDFDSLIEALSSINLSSSSLKSGLGFIVTRAIQNLTLQYQEAEKKVLKIVKRLKEHQLVIKQDLEVLQKQAKSNKLYYKTISLYIYAGELKIAQIESEVLPSLESSSRISAESAERYRKELDDLEHFKKRLQDLNLSKNIALQVSTELDLLIKNDSAILERIDSLLDNTIPLWKNQIALALGISDANEALMQGNNAASTLNSAIHSNSQRLQDLSRKTTSELKRRKVNISALQQTQSELLDTIHKVQLIQQDGKKERQQSEASLQAIELELLKKLGGA